MTVKLSIGRIQLNSIRFKASLFAKHWTYQTLNECINESLVVLPIEKYRLLNQFIQCAGVGDVKFFVEIFRRAREGNDSETVNGNNSIKYKTTFVGDHTTYLALKEKNRYLRCDFAA